MAQLGLIFEKLGRGEKLTPAETSFLSSWASNAQNAVALVQTAFPSQNRLNVSYVDAEDVNVPAGLIKMGEGSFPELFTGVFMAYPAVTLNDGNDYLLAALDGGAVTWGIQDTGDAPDSWTLVDTGEKVPTAVGSTGTWSNWTVARLNSSDNSRATDAQNGQSGTPGEVSNFNFGIPSGARIDGIKVIAECFETSAGSVPFYCALSWDGGTSWTSNKYVLMPDASTGEEDRTLGGSTNTWGRTWSDSELSDTNFRARFYIGDSLGASCGIDFLRIVVYYAT